MKVLIDIPKEIKRIIDANGTNEHVEYICLEAIRHGTPIPDNATNGDVIKTMFPEINKYFSNVIEWRLWWNAQYQKGGK